MSDLPDWAASLDLQPHPEGGWYVETYRHRSTALPAGYDGSRALATGIHFLLLPGEASAWHRVRSDELWLWHRGGPLVLDLGGDAAEPALSSSTRMGGRIEDGESLQALVPGGHWQAARPAGDEPVLVSCVVVPGFDFADFELA